MDDTPLVAVEKVAASVGLDPLEYEDRIIDAILDAQGAVEGYLHRTIVPVEQVFAGVSPAWGAVDLNLASAWPYISELVDDEWRVTTHTAHGDGTWTVTGSVGLNGAEHRPIITYIKAHAVASLQNDPLLDGVPRPVKTLAREGQSLTFETGSTAKGAAGAAPNLDSLKKWRRVVIHRRRTQRLPLWPN